MCGWFVPVTQPVTRGAGGGSAVRGLFWISRMFDGVKSMVHSSLLNSVVSFKFVVFLFAALELPCSDFILGGDVVSCNRRS